MKNLSKEKQNSKEKDVNANKTLIVENPSSLSALNEILKKNEEILNKFNIKNENEAKKIKNSSDRVQFFLEMLLLNDKGQPNYKNLTDLEFNFLKQRYLITYQAAVTNLTGPNEIQELGYGMRRLKIGDHSRQQAKNFQLKLGMWVFFFGMLTFLIAYFFRNVSYE
ncbi:hypothetical protein HDU92_003887 [Lobulomyces angularis]|nr:hypothetical protein HDU92_003887 [Lobulomyces angularis]